MGRRLRWNLRLGILGFLVACSHQRSPLPELRMVEQAIRSRIGRERNLASVTSTAP